MLPIRHQSYELILTKRLLCSVTDLRYWEWNHMSCNKEHKHTIRKTIWSDLESIRNLAYVDMNFGFLRAKSYLLNISSTPPCLLSDKLHKTITQSDHTSTQNTKCRTVFHRKGSFAIGFDLACLEAEEVDLFSLSTFLVWRNNFRGGASKPYPNKKITCGKQTKRIRICLLKETWTHINHETDTYRNSQNCRIKR